MSAILGIISLISLGAVVYLSYLRDGDAPPGYGITGILALLFSVTGFLLGILTARDEENFLLFPVLGMVLNFLAIAGVCFLVYIGM